MAATARGEGGTVSCAASESSLADKRVTNGGGSQRTLAAATLGIPGNTAG